MTEQQQALLRKAQDSLRAAQVLANEALYDFAISRAYYTMFYVAEAFLLGKGLSFSSHAAVISAFGQHFACTGDVSVEFHRYLINAQNMRVRGDYDVDANLTQADAVEEITWAEQFLELALQQL
ncbi:MAG: hypothetical protein Kow00121_60990 [Elainellaceae cyanobacterium]